MKRSIHLPFSMKSRSNMTTLKTIYMSLISLLSICICSCRCDDVFTNATTSGFTADLIHRDSPLSPSYDPSSPPSQRLADTLRRSFNRMQYLNQLHRQPHPSIVNSGGEYFMEYSVGSPPLASLGIADTGSDLTWTQCQPCRKCFNQTLPIFAPKSSSTYRKVSCNTRQCSYFQDTSSCSSNGKNCRYSVTYGDSSFSAGNVATDTIKLGKVSIPRIVFGCGSRNGGHGAGIVGLGWGKGSLVRQLGPLAQGKFSYCLVSLSDVSNSSKLNFGASGVVSGRGVVTTPLVRKMPGTLYYLTLEGISIGKRRLKFHEPHSRARVEGNIVIDSGTTLTMLPPRLYAEVESELRRRIKLKAVRDPLGMLSLCYLSPGDLRIPDVTVHFRGGDVRLHEENVFARTNKDTLCLAAVAARDLAIYGNLAQVNFLVGYDLVKRTVSFKRADCGKR